MGKTVRRFFLKPSTTNGSIHPDAWRRRALGACAVLVLIGLPNVQTATKPAIDFVATDLNGKPFYGRSLEGKIVLLDFWAVWCPPCLKAIPVLGKLHRDLGGEDFQVLGIAVYSGTREDVSGLVREHHIEYPMVVGDDDIVEDFGVIGYPTYFVIDPEGAVYKKYVGELEDLYDRVARDVATLKER
jgi:thiol-disulfide isomerase/thioredoxin